MASGKFSIDDAFQSDDDDPIRIYGSTTDSEPLHGKRRPSESDSRGERGSNKEVWLYLQMLTWLTIQVCELFYFSLNVITPVSCAIVMLFLDCRPKQKQAFWQRMDGYTEGKPRVKIKHISGELTDQQLALICVYFDPQAQWSLLLG